MVEYKDKTGLSPPASIHNLSMQQAVTKGKIEYKHHAYTFSHYSNCARTDQLEHLMKDDDRIQV